MGRESWIKLQQEFETQRNPISQSYLIWTDRSRKQWLLADFGNKKTYYIDSLSETGAGITGDGEHPLVDVSELPDLNEKLKDAQTICNLLRDTQTGRVPQGTLSGFITLMMEIDLDEIDLETLKRPNLSGSRLDFESVHQGLAVVHGFFREVLTLSSVDPINLSDATVQTIRDYLPQFYEVVEEIEDFNVSGENPTEKHEEISKKISEYCREARSTLEPIIAYLRSAQIEKSQTQFNDFFHEAVKKWEKLDNENEAKLQTLDDLILKQENRLTEILIADYVKIFEDQAKVHQEGAKRWFWGTVYLAIGSVAIFFLLWFFMKPAGDQLAAVLQNFLIKGFLVSVFYMLLNRSIKNYTAEKHLEIVNLHRKNALATFDAFADAAGENRDTRDQVLLASTDAIFHVNQSGYLSVKTSHSDSANPIQQIFRAIVPNK